MRTSRSKPKPKKRQTGIRKPTKVVRKARAKTPRVKGEAAKKRPVVVAAAAAPAVPARQRSYAISNSLVLLAATVTLAITAGWAALPTLFAPAEALANRPEAMATIESQIDRAIAQGRVGTGDLPLIVQTIPVVPTEAKSAVKTEPKIEPISQSKIDISAEPKAPSVPDSKIETKVGPKIEAKPEAKLEPKSETKIEPKPEAKPTPKGKAQRRLERHAARELPKPGRNEGLEALASASAGNSLIAEARKYLGTNPTGRASLWCGAFLDMVLKRTGHRGGGNLARGYIKYGTRIAGPEVGAIVVFARQGGGHVGIVTGIDSNGNPIVISGNHNHRVAVATYPAKRALAYVMPNG
jgi:uncharacterized protein (TIGR02594 family)